MTHDFSQLDKPVQFLKGVGPKRSEALGRMGIVTARDLLYHVPRRYDDASTIQPVSALEVGMGATAVGRVRSKGVIPTRSGLRIFQAVLKDDTGMITCAIACGDAGTLMSNVDWPCTDIGVRFGRIVPGSSTERSLYFRIALGDKDAMLSGLQTFL